MLYIDGKKDKLAQSYIHELKDEVGDGRCLQSPPELLSKLRTQKDDAMITVGPHKAIIHYSDTFYGTIKRNDQGEIIGIDFNKHNRAADNHKVTYYETSETKFDNTLHNFKPEYLSVGGTNKPNTHILQQNDYEKYWFLSRISRKIKNSQNAEANTMKDYCLYIAAPEKDATIKRTSGAARRRLENRVMEEAADGGFTIEELQNIGRHLSLPMKNFRNTDQLRDAIMLAAAKDETDRVLSGDPLIKGYEYVLQLGNKRGPDYELRELVSAAMEMGVIEHDIQRKQFVYKMDGHIVGNICPVDDGAPIKQNVLISFLKHDVESRERIERLVNPIIASPSE